MRVRVKGKNDKITKAEIKEAANFMLSLLVTNKMHKNISLLVEFMESGDQGDCMYTDDEATNHRDFHVRINSSYSKRKQLIILGHELVHVKQFAYNEMKYHSRDFSKMIWMKRVVDEKKVHYYDLPYEIEAYGRELGLYSRYVKHKRKTVHRRKSK